MDTLTVSASAATSAGPYPVRLEQDNRPYHIRANWGPRPGRPATTPNLYWRTWSSIAPIVLDFSQTEPIGISMLSSSESADDSRIVAILAEIEAAYSEAREPNWDGDGASPVLAETYDLACHLAHGIGEVPAPEISIDPDGDILFEWTGDGRQMLTASISPDQKLSYAAMRENDRRSGTEPFSNAAIQTLVDCLRWVKLLDDD